VLASGILVAVLSGGCRTPGWWRERADRAATAIVADAQQQAVGRTETLPVDSPADTLRRRLIETQRLPHTGPASKALRDLQDNEYWTRARHLPPAPERDGPWPGEGTLKPNLTEALQIAARNSRDFQAAKARVFTAALSLDLERREFRTTFAGMLQGLFSSDPLGNDRQYGAVGTADGSASRRFRNGTELSAGIVADLAKLLSQERGASLGFQGDVSVTVPLLRGSGRLIVEEPLRQAERNVLYAVWEFEQFKRDFAVRIAGDYLDVLLARCRVANAEENYKSLVTSTRRTRRLADSGRLQEYEFDQAVQNELQAREGWIQSRFSYERTLDRFKVSLGLPPDARLELVDEELARLRERAVELTAGVEVADYRGTVPPADAPVVLQEPSREHAGPLELDEAAAIGLALANRPDLHVALGRVEDAQREVMVAADALRAELTLLGSAGAGERRSSPSSAGSPNAAFDLEEASASALLTLDLPFERTRERTAYRQSLLSLEEAVRDFQAAEDNAKMAVRDGLRALAQSRESVANQAQAVRLAEKRVRSTDMFLQAGRAAVRDLLDAQEALLGAQNGLISAIVSRRVTEWELQRDLGKLEVTVDGLWQEYRPERVP
jgi:outer membrane protein TolC